MFYNKRRRCSSKAKIGNKNKKFIITELYNKKISQETISYEEFVKPIETNNIESISFKEVKIQKFYIIIIIHSINKNK